jgi:hypothetical protein
MFAAKPTGLPQCGQPKSSSLIRTPDQDRIRFPNIVAALTAEHGSSPGFSGYFLA